MKTKLVSLLLLVPFFASSQNILNPNNYPVFTFNNTGTDHTTDVNNYFTRTVMTGFYQGQTQFWGYDASTATNILLNSVTDASNTQSFFATAHNATGALSWFITSQSSGTNNAYGTSKMVFNPTTGTYAFCVEYASVLGNPLEFLSSSSGPIAIAAPGSFGLLSIHVDGAGNILSLCNVVTSSSPVELEDIALDEATGMVYITGYRQGTLANAYVISYMPGTCAGGGGISAGFANNSWGRGIDVEASEVFVTGDFENMVTWGGLSVSTTASQDVFVLRLNAGLIPSAITGARAMMYAEAYDVEVLSGFEVHVSGSIRQQSFAWNIGNFGVSFPGALHGFIQLFDPVLNSTCSYVRVPATAANEVFKMVDLDENIIPPGTGLPKEITIGGNMNHSGPSFDVYGLCVLISPNPLSAPLNQAGFVYQVDQTLVPVWGNISTLTTSMGSAPPTVTAVSNYELDIFVGGYKNDDVVLTPTSTGDFIPNLGNLTMNAYYTYIFSNAGTGDFQKTATSVTELAEEEEVRFAVYPNPASDVLYLRMDDAAQLQRVFLKDLAGRTIQAWNGHEAAGGLAVGDVPAGVYFMEIEGNGIRATERVVIQ